jgi:hypothetical protein
MNNQVTAYQDLHEMSDEQLQARLNELLELESGDDWRLLPRAPQDERRLIEMVVDYRKRERAGEARRQQHLEKVRGLPETPPVRLAGRLLSFEERVDLAAFIRSRSRADQVELARFCAAVLAEELNRPEEVRQ